MMKGKILKMKLHFKNGQVKPIKTVFGEAFSIFTPFFHTKFNVGLRNIFCYLADLFTDD